MLKASREVVRAAVCWHRRSGKDDTMMHFNAVAAHMRVGNYWYLLPEYNQCRKAIWDAVNPHTGKKRIDEAFPMEIREKTLTQEMKIVFTNGSTWQLMGSDNYDALVGSPPVGLTFSEYALSNPSSWGFLRPILLENGGWAIFNSTPRGKNHFHKLIKLAQKRDNWFSETLTVDQTGVFTKEQLLNELEEIQDEHGEAYGKAIWLQEYYCSFDAAVPGSIWGEAIVKLTLNNQVGAISHNDEYSVHTAWDLGRRDKTSVWFYQIIGDRLNILDYWGASFKEIPDLCEMLIEKKELNKWVYGTHWFPHDARPIRMGMGGKSIYAQFLDQRRNAPSLGDFRFTPELSREDGIQAARATFRRAYFNKGTCDDGLEHLKAYHRKYDEEKKEFSEPVHDDHSHPADAWRYLSLSWREAKEENPELTPQQKLYAGNITGISFGQMKKNFLAQKRALREDG